MAAGTPIYRHLTDDGLVADGSNNNANVNGVVTAVPHYAGPADGKIWRLERMLVTIEDAGSLAAGTYGAISALANGCTLKVMRNSPTGTEVLDLMDSAAATVNSDWGTFCYDIAFHTFGAGNNFLLSRWTFAKSGAPLFLNGANSDTLVLLVQDDLTGLVGHKFFIQGVESTE